VAHGNLRLAKLPSRALAKLLDVWCSFGISMLS